MSEASELLEIRALNAADTNAEYIKKDVANQQPPVLKSVARSIIIDTIKDLFVSVANFFIRFFKHFLNCFIFFWSPTLKKKPFDKMDFKENSKVAFEFMMFVLLTLIFMIKVGWVPPPSKEMLAIYNDNLIEKVLELAFFLLFAFMYLLVTALSIFTGRLICRIFKPGITTRESDILFVYMNNAYFSFTAIVALIIRSSASAETYTTESIEVVIILIILPIVLITILIWSIRFAFLHRMKFLKGSLFFITTFIIFSLFYLFATYVIALVGAGL